MILITHRSKLTPINKTQTTNYKYNRILSVRSTQTTSLQCINYKVEITH